MLLLLQNIHTAYIVVQFEIFTIIFAKLQNNVESVNSL